ncbi:MAG: PAS domain-containing sensor histidine kinase [Bacteroidota bacterium]|nr:PAS domain-containing sensor histidine kinase [Bacteroidota bacterium]
MKLAETKKPEKSSTSEQLKDAILNSLSSQIAVLNKAGVIQTVNESWKIFGKENSTPNDAKPDYIGMNYLEVCRRSEGQFSEEASEALTGIRSVLEGSISSFTLEYACHTPTTKRWYLMKVTALPDNFGAVVSHTDITERKAIEQMKDEFISIASHELKTPITSLKGIVHILQLSFAKKMKGDGAKLLSTMDSQLNKLTQIIKDLLEVNTIPGNINLNIEEFDFSKLVQETMENVQNLSQLHFLSAKANESISFRGDRRRLEQVITNLLTNAVKYSPQSNQVIITSAFKDNSILLSIQDFGIGIEKENQDKIFDRFYRVKNNSGFGGLGLGLFISAKIIKAHNGDIWVESQPGRGSTFYISLPHYVDEGAVFLSQRN